MEIIATRFRYDKSARLARYAEVFPVAIHPVTGKLSSINQYWSVASSLVMSFS